MKEYGGYIEFERFHGKEYHENAIALNSGRHCVEYLIRAKDIHKLWLPFFMCDSVKKICDRLNVIVSYYHTDIHFLPQCDKYFEGDEYIYIVNYYGQLSNETIKKFKKEYGNIIIDNVQAFFQMPVENTDTLYSCRKFFGVPDGAYLYTDRVLKEQLETDISYNRMLFLLGRFEKTANEFYAQYVENNKLFYTESMKNMSVLTHNLLKGIDYSYIENVRLNNFRVLQKKLSVINKFDVIEQSGAFMYPLYIDNGYDVRKKLQQNNIYIPTLWPDVFNITSEKDIEYDMARNIIPLPVDQRYNEKDMKYIVKILKEVDIA